MLDFIRIVKKEAKRRGDGYIVKPEFTVRRSDDLMIKGGAFYAIWDEEAQRWSTDEMDVKRLIDRETRLYIDHHDLGDCTPIYTSAYDNGIWDTWKRYVRNMPDNFVPLDSNIIFKNQDVSKYDYATKTLSYSLEECPIPAYDKIMSVIYEPEERKKLEWAIGSIVAGESKKIQKFIVLYGPPGTGKSTILHIIEKMFEYQCVNFDAKKLGANNRSFILDAFRTNPMIAIQHDGDLSHIEDNTVLNSIVSHESMLVEEKFKSSYQMTFNTFLMLGTNKPVRITDANSGLMRRLIDVYPSGNKLGLREYERLMSQVDYELPGIAYHCLEVFNELGAGYYHSYRPDIMMSKTNDFFNFISDNYALFEPYIPTSEGMPLKIAWTRYKTYCEDTKTPYPMSMRTFKSELMNYFRTYRNRDGANTSMFYGFRNELIDGVQFEADSKNVEDDGWLKLEETASLLDVVLADCPAQPAVKTVRGDREIPKERWGDVTTVLSDIDTSTVHYVQPPGNLIVIDFDLKDSFGHKDMEANIKAAKDFPPTYAELSKGGGGLHLHYYYDGDVSELASVYAKDIEIKVFTGNAGLRRRVSLCNSLDIATIHCGLPIKERKTMVTETSLKSEKGLRDLIYRNLRKEIHPNTAPSVDFIYKILEDAYNSGMPYDVTDLRTNIQDFCMSSTHQSDHCMSLLMKMKFRSEDQPPDDPFPDEEPIVFYDVEVFPNLFVLCYKIAGPGKQIVKLINPTAAEVLALFSYRLVGFNNRKYDNHILYARSQGYSNEALFDLSQRIIANDKDSFFRQAYNLSYTDIYDFLSAQNKMSLKKWEIKLGIHHNELGLPWDKPVPEELWDKVAKYCGDDVFATEALWDSKYGQTDWLARQILADISDLTPNDTTNNCTTKLIVGNDRHPQDQFVYTDLSEIFPGYEYNPYGIDKERYNEGTKIVKGLSIYRGEDPGEGGYVYAEPGVYNNVAMLDIASMHPNSIIQLNLFGDVYTMRFKELVDLRLAIKHKDFDTAERLLDGILTPYIERIKAGEFTPKQVADALKTAINSVYGLTSARFENRLRDPRNIDNIVAKRGALFMINLKHEVQDLGFKVIHIKTDSIKIADATPEIIQFVMDYGKEYGYSFEHEASYDRIALMNDAVYVARHMMAEECMDRYGYVPDNNEDEEGKWTATGAQFQVPYVFKTLFSHEPIEFKDMCETKAVSSAIFLDFNEGLDSDWHNYRHVGKVGLFCPVVDGVGGGVLLRQSGEDKFDAVNGSLKPDKTPYRWMEAEMVKELGLEDKIDISYYRKLVDDAIEDISKFCDFEEFVVGYGSDEWMNTVPGPEEVPFPMNEPQVA